MIIGANELGFGPDNPTGEGYARVVSGKDWSVIHTFDGADTGDGLGYAVAAAGDVNADGFVDLIVGAPFTDQNGENSGSAWVFSGCDACLVGTNYCGPANRNSTGQAAVIAGPLRDVPCEFQLIRSPEQDRAEAPVPESVQKLHPLLRRPTAVGGFRFAASWKHGEFRATFAVVPFCCEFTVDLGYFDAHVAGVDRGVHPERLEQMQVTEHAVLERVLQGGVYIRKQMVHLGRLSARVSQAVFRSGGARNEAALEPPVEIQCDLVAL